jgi:NAD(P)-dependent dehydrogenase (short-subunit alcohol dehydrogenase family)
VHRADIYELFDLTGRVAIVTGGSRGIGRSIALGYAAAGAKVVVASRKAEACDAVADEIVAAGGEALSVPTHLGDVEALAALVEATVARFNGVDVLVNNAANALAQNMGGYTMEAWQKSYDVNLFGPVLLAQHALPYLEKSPYGGTIINVISVGAFSASPRLAIYGSNKAALQHWTKSMAKELAHRGVRVNALAPGPFLTDMVKANGPDGMARMQSATALDRIADPDEIIGAALLLASKAGSFMTGSTLVVDGGLSA